MSIGDAELEAEGDDFTLPLIDKGSVEFKGCVARCAETQADFEAFVEGAAAAGTSRSGSVKGLPPMLARSRAITL